MPTVREIEEAIGTVIEADTALKVRPVVWELLEGEGRKAIEAGVAIGSPTTAPSTDGHCFPWTTTVMVRVARRLRSDGSRSDYLDALDETATVWSATMKALGAASLDVRYAPAGVERQVVGDGTWLLSEFSVDVSHKDAGMVG